MIDTIAAGLIGLALIGYLVYLARRSRAHAARLVGGRAGPRSGA